MGQGQEAHSGCSGSNFCEELMGKGPMQETSVSIGELLDKSREESGAHILF